MWRVRRRDQLGTRLKRLAVLEQHSASTQGLLTERTARALRKTRDVEAEVPGELLSLDTFYVGRLKGVGKVWPITGCDVASSHTWAQAFRRHYFTSRAALQRALDRYLGFYSLGRPHRGYRLRGLTPATKFAGAIAR